jgi:membrane protease YdiL (CAAX protease family)
LQMTATVNRRPGKLWAFLQFPLTRFLLGAAVIILWVVLVQVGLHLAHVPSRSPLGALAGLVIAAGVIGLYRALVRFVERRPVTELAAAEMAKHLSRGILTGAILFCASMLVMRLLGGWYPTVMAPLSVLIYPCLGALVAGVQEEILVRGLLFRLLEERLGSWIALAVSALIFGLLHAFNPGATAVSTAAIALEAGVLLAAAYMYTRSLWFVIGLHFAWNFTEGGIFSTSVSGGHVEGMIGVQFTGSDTLTGGSFGPEASLPAVLVCLAAGAAFIILSVRAGRIVSPFWSRRSAAPEHIL